MLSEMLKKRDLFPESRLDNERKDAAKEVIRDCAETLVIAMRAAELYGRMTRKDVEDYVLETLEEFEKHYYSEAPEEFEFFIRMMMM